jgi:hypothetical protein
MRKRLFLKIIFLSFLILSSLILPQNKALAASDFGTHYEIHYFLKETGKVKVEQKISLTNKASGTYPTEYLLETGGVGIENITASDGGGKITPSLKQKDDSLEIRFKFNERVVGEGKTLTFDVAYELLGAMIKNGQVWEVNLPRIPNLDNSSRGKITLAVPHSFGPPAFITPDNYIEASDASWHYFAFGEEKITTSALNAAFGEFQVFDFSLNYHLQNPHSSKGKTSIALPADSSFQRVYLEKITPPPKEITMDNDGNWLGAYFLKGEEELRIKVSGWAQIFSEPLAFYPQPGPAQLEENLTPQPYWESDHPEIAKKASELKSPEKIYQFVVDTLEYDYSRVEKQNRRKGALAALAEPRASICMEFSDLFIALARAAGIPAREINGFAYTINPRLKPLGLVSDVLHSWPEYYHQEKKAWIPIDPTWGNTTKGRDYFNKLDLNHLGFVAHGSSSQFPLPAGAYKTGSEAKKDIQVVFGDYHPYKPGELSVSFDFVKSPVPKESLLLATVKNPGPAAVYSLNLKFLSQGIDLAPGFNKETLVQMIPPLGKKEVFIRFKKPKNLSFGDAQVSLLVNEKKFDHPFRLESLIWPQILVGLIGGALGIIASFLLISVARLIAKKLGPAS